MSWGQQEPRHLLPGGKFELGFAYSIRRAALAMVTWCAELAGPSCLTCAAKGWSWSNLNTSDRASHQAGRRL